MATSGVMDIVVVSPAQCGRKLIVDIKGFIRGQVLTDANCKLAVDEVFELFDRDKNGQFEIKELNQAVQVVLTKIQLVLPSFTNIDDLAKDHFFDKYDANHDGMISKAEFLHFVEGVVQKVKESDAMQVRPCDRKQLLADMAAFADAVRADSQWLLILCLLLDAIGMLSYLIPFFGEIFDVWWAPMFFFILHFIFGKVLLSSLGALEEFVPFTDILPTATIGWAIMHVPALDFVRRKLGMESGPRKLD